MTVTDNGNRQIQLRMNYAAARAAGPPLPCDKQQGISWNMYIHPGRSCPPAIGG